MITAPLVFTALALDIRLGESRRSERVRFTDYRGAEATRERPA